MFAQQRFKKRGGNEGPSNKKRGGESKKNEQRTSKVPSCAYFKKTNHTKNFYWFVPDIRCQTYEKLGHA